MFISNSLATTFAFQSSNPPMAMTNYYPAAPVISMGASALSYATITNFLYIARRSSIRKMPKRKLWEIRTTRQPGVSIRLYLAMIFTWQAFVLIFPIVEPIARCFSRVSFFYSYPNAGGVGIILEPTDVQHLAANKRSKRQIRFDWHRFSINVGGIGRDGYKHPPSVMMNVPHLDIPERGMKHWPWRRRHTVEEKKS